LNKNRKDKFKNKVKNKMKIIKFNNKIKNKRKIRIEKRIRK
jgi:hypothetical protein